MGRHLERRAARRRERATAAAAAPGRQEPDVLRLTPWRGLTGIGVPLALLVFGAVFTPLWADAAWLAVFCAAILVLFPLAFLPWHPPPWVDRWHGRFLVVGAVLGGCAAAVFVPLSVVSLVRAVVGATNPAGEAWLPMAGVIVAGPLLLGTTRTYWRTADGLARRAFGGRSRLSTKDLERTFE